MNAKEYVLDSIIDVLSRSNNDAKIKYTYEEKNGVVVAFNIHGERIETIPENCFQKLSNLRHLSITNTNIKIIEKGTFAGLENLKFLTVESNCKLKEIHKLALEPLINLEILNLSLNAIQRFYVELFQNNLNLRNIFLHGNNYYEIPSRLFENLEKLEALNIQTHSIAKRISGISGLKLRVKLKNITRFEKKHQIFIEILENRDNKENPLEHLQPSVQKEYKEFIELFSDYSIKYGMALQFLKDLKEDKIRSDYISFTLDELDAQLRVFEKEFEDDNKLFRYYEGRDEILNLISRLHEIEVMK